MVKKVLFFLLFSCTNLIFSQNTTYTLVTGETFEMISIPGQNFAAGQTEVTQSLYSAIMGDNPSTYESENNPAVDTVSWWDTIVFCNKLSLALDKTPCYTIKGSTTPDDWDYTPHEAAGLFEQVEWDKESDGFRLLTEEEWIFAARGNTETKYAGSDNIEEVAWYRKNSLFIPHDTGTKMANEFGLYDMSGNVWEWIWDMYDNNPLYRIYKGGSCSSDKELCTVSFKGHHYPSRNTMSYSYLTIGFRIGMTTKK